MTGEPGQHRVLDPLRGSGGTGPGNSASGVTIEPVLFRKFRRIARERAGIVIADGKEALVTARVAKRLRALGIDSPRRYLRYLEGADGEHELVSFLDVISTKFTGFFREPEHFDLLAQRISEVVAQGRTRVRLWSAACATGEEPYSMAIAVSEAPAKKKGRRRRSANPRNRPRTERPATYTGGCLPGDQDG